MFYVFWPYYHLQQLIFVTLLDKLKNSTTEYRNKWSYICILFYFIYILFLFYFIFFNIKVWGTVTCRDIWSKKTNCIFAFNKAGRNRASCLVWNARHENFIQKLPSFVFRAWPTAVWSFRLRFLNDTFPLVTSLLWTKQTIEKKSHLLQTENTPRCHNTTFLKSQKKKLICCFFILLDFFSFLFSTQECHKIFHMGPDTRHRPHTFQLRPRHNIWWCCEGFWQSWGRCDR